MIRSVTVSIIVAVYNMERYLAKCIDSVLAQSYSDYELILINDGSQDTSEKIIDAYIERYPDKVRKINKRHEGVSSARNAGLEALRGKYVAFLDADDYYDREYLKTLVDKAEGDNLDMVCSGQHKITEGGVILNTIRCKTVNGQCLQRRLNNHGKLYRTAYIQKWNLLFPDGKIYEENSFNLQAMFLTNRVVFLDYVGYYQVVHEGSITATPIDASKLPFDAWESCAVKIRREAVAGVDLELFDLTYVSFFTYFLMIRNRKREYLPHDDKFVLMNSVNQIASEFERIIKTHFREFGNNRYIRLFSYRELPLTQKLGTRVFWWLSIRNRLKPFIKLVYSFI